MLFFWIYMWIVLKFWFGDRNANCFPPCCSFHGTRICHKLSLQVLIQLKLELKSKKFHQFIAVKRRSDCLSRWKANSFLWNRSKSGSIMSHCISAAKNECFTRKERCFMKTPYIPAIAASLSRKMSQRLDLKWRR